MHIKVNFVATCFQLNSVYIQMRREHRRARVGRPIETEKRLSAGQAVVVIAALSVLSWAVLIAILIGLRAVF